MPTIVRYGVLPLAGHPWLIVGDEIAFICQQGEDIATQEMQEALLVSLNYARSDEEALPVLQALVSSSNAHIAQAAQTMLGRKNK